MYRTPKAIAAAIARTAATADDDQDGATDEDWLNGFDDDGDGQVDEDFAAISKQMFASQYTDYGSASIQIYPNHNPLNLHVRQESYAWEEDRFDDFIGAEFYITNRGNDVLEDMYLGFFADGDAGSRDVDNYFEDDGAALYPQSGGLHGPRSGVAGYRVLLRRRRRRGANRRLLRHHVPRITRSTPLAKWDRSAWASRPTRTSRDKPPTKTAATRPTISSATSSWHPRPSSAMRPSAVTTAC